MSEKNKIAVVIPAYEPDKKLLTYIEKLSNNGISQIIVIDDGSGDEYCSIFKSFESSATVLHHKYNKGKGAALKTGYIWIQRNLPEVQGGVTADSDGQHTVEDCIRLAEKLGKEEVLLLGARDFNLPDIPSKSRSGNKITTIVFKLLYGEYLKDTQTGLRAFPVSILPFMINVDGNRYEYEMKVLIACSRSKIPMISIPIETVYENNNEGTHFHPIKDSWKIYKVIFGSFFKFMGSSLVSTLVDQGFFNLFNLVVFSNGTVKSGSLIFLSTVIARVVSASLNFILNRNIVFESNAGADISFGRYVILCIGLMLLSAVGTWLLSIIGFNSTIAKLITDTLLYFLSYKIQETFVFR